MLLRGTWTASNPGHTTTCCITARAHQRGKANTICFFKLDYEKERNDAKTIENGFVFKDVEREKVFMIERKKRQIGERSLSSHIG